MNPYCLLLFFVYSTLFILRTDAQPASFQMSMDIVGHRLGEVMVNEEDDIIAFFYGPPFTIPSLYGYMINLSKGNVSQSAVSFNLPVFSQFWLLRNAAYSRNTVSILQSTSFSNSAGIVLLNYDVITGSYWCRRNKHLNISTGDFINDESGNTLILNTGYYHDILELYLLDSLGNDIWHRGIRVNKAGFNTFLVKSDEIGILPGTGYFISGAFQNFNNSGQDEFFLIKTGLDGSPIAMKTIQEFSSCKLYTGNGGVYLLGKTKVDYPFTENQANALLARFGPNLEFEWARVFHADAFEYANTTLNVTAAGDLVLGYSTFGAFPVVLAKLDATGNLLWQKGYPLYEPQIDALSNGSLLLTTRFHFDSTGAVFPKMIIAKTDPAGDIEGCPTLPACLKSESVNLTFDTLFCDSFSLDSLLPVAIESNPAQFSFSDFCDTPAPPDPYFVFPDTLCQGDTAWTTDTYNALAHKIEWRLTGVNTDIFLEDTLSFGHRFLQPGSYKLAQTLWFLGCAYSFEQNITVLEDLSIQIHPSGKVCELPPVKLTLQAGKPLKTFLWNTTESSPGIEVSQNGIYTVTVSDGFCVASSSTDIQLAALQFGNKPPLLLPADTALCPEELPWSPPIQSDFSNLFSIDGGPFLQPPFNFNQEGQYAVTVNIDGCDYAGHFSLQIKDCEKAVYLPNVFSPNGDGINDLFYAQGKNFQAVRLSIFDRWGGLIKEFNNGDFQWDGTGSPAGVYVYKFEFIDTFLKKNRSLTGTVTLIR